jgi:hypothetical protein
MGKPWCLWPLGLLRWTGGIHQVTNASQDAKNPEGKHRPSSFGGPSHVSTAGRVVMKVLRGVWRRGAGGGLFHSGEFRVIGLGHSEPGRGHVDPGVCRRPGGAHDPRRRLRSSDTSLHGAVDGSGSPGTTRRCWTHQLHRRSLEHAITPVPPVPEPRRLRRSIRPVPDRVRAPAPPPLRTRPSEAQRPVWLVGAP